MARIFKTGARKPRIDEGNAWTGTNVRWAPPEGGFVRAVGTDYTLTVSATAGKAEYVAHLSEDEMLATVTSWLRAMTTQRATRAREAEQAAAKARGEHHNMRDRGRS